MFNSSALNTTITLASLFATYASAADSVVNYTGTIADLTGEEVFGKSGETRTVTFL